MDNEKLNILKLLIENQEQSFSIRKISIIRKINYKSAYNAVMKLNKDGTISLNKTGNTTICSFTRRFNDDVFKAEYSRRETLLKNRDMAIIWEDLNKIESLHIAVIFGSYIRGKKGSDIDILAITDAPKPLEEQLSLLALNIHLTAVSLKDFMIMLRSKKTSVVSEAIRKNIILTGIEDYYRMINNA